MSVEPVTVTVTTEIETGEVQHQIARVEAAKELGLEPHEIVCHDVGPVSITRQAVWSEALEAVYGDPDPTTGAVRVLRDAVPSTLVTPAEYSFSSTWAPKNVDPKRVHAPAQIPWPDVKLVRGAKWHGLVPSPDGGDPYEAMLISDGERLVLIDSPDGQAVLKEIGGEKPVTVSSTANNFG